MNITVEFTHEKKVVRYPDGKVGEYPKEKIQGHRQELLKRKEILDRQIAELDKDLGDIEVEKVKKAGEASVG